MFEPLLACWPGVTRGESLSQSRNWGTPGPIARPARKLRDHVRTPAGTSEVSNDSGNTDGRGRRVSGSREVGGLRRVGAGGSFLPTT
jgi:hypothetical protein